MKRLVLPLLSILIASTLLAQRPERPQPPDVPARPSEEQSEAVERPVQPQRSDRQAPPAADKISTTQHTVTINGQSIAYTARAGTIVMKSEDGSPTASIFFVAYTKDGENPARRPVTFTFNGGPGSSSVWLHMGALGPKRVKMQDDGMMPAPPYQLVTNDHTWLDLTDLVFIDPVGTGYSRATRPELASNGRGVFR